MLKKMNKKGGLAISQIIILVIGIIAISYAVGSSVGEVSAVEIGGTRYFSAEDNYNTMLTIKPQGFAYHKVTRSAVGWTQNWYNSVGTLTHKFTSSSTSSTPPTLPPSTEGNYESWTFVPVEVPEEEITIVPDIPPWWVSGNPDYDYYSGDWDDYYGGSGDSGGDSNTCDANHLDLCLNNIQCVYLAGGVWFEDKCLEYIPEGVGEDEDYLSEFSFLTNLPTPATPADAPSGPSASYYDDLEEFVDGEGTTPPETSDPPSTETPSAEDASLSALQVLGIIGIGVVQIGVHAGIAKGLNEGISATISFFCPSCDVDFWDDLGDWAGWGYAAGAGATTLVSTIVALGGTELVKGSAAAFWLGPIGAGIIGAGGAAIATIIYLATYKKQAQEVYIFNCYPWMPETGGINCDKCGDDGLPCSKYECQSLGQACKLLNEGTDDEICYWNQRDNIDPPEIQAWEAVLDPELYDYTPDGAHSPPDRGVIIEYLGSDDKCIPAFTPMGFGIELDKPAICKIVSVRESSFEEMDDNYFSNMRFLYNHSVFTSFLSTEATEAEGLIVENGGEQEWYVRCMGENGEPNPGNFVFKFCVSQQDDITPPKIIYPMPPKGWPIVEGALNQEVTLYLNEPSKCNWDHTDKSYESMTGGSMTCETEKNSLMLYECVGTVDGLIDNVENKFYFRCQDTAGNTNGASYEYSLFGTIPLIIDSVAPDGIIKGSSNSVKVTLQARTSAGYYDGAAVCKYSESCYKEDGSAVSYVDFVYEVGTELYSQHQHSQDLWLSEGTYDCSIQCSDLGGNMDTKTTSYTIETDTDPPIIVRAYHDGGKLNLITNEPAECRYSTSTRNYIFDDGVRMSSSDDLIHSVTWDTDNNLYIKCQDEYGSQPSGCSIILRPFEFF